MVGDDVSYSGTLRRRSAQAATTGHRLEVAEPFLMRDEFRALWPTASAGTGKAIGALGYALITRVYRIECQNMAGAWRGSPASGKPPAMFRQQASARVAPQQSPILSPAKVYSGG